MITLERVRDLKDHAKPQWESKREFCSRLNKEDRSKKPGYFQLVPAGAAHLNPGLSAERRARGSSSRHQELQLTLLRVI